MCVLVLDVMLRYVRGLLWVQVWVGVGRGGGRQVHLAHLIESGNKLKLAWSKFLLVPATWRAGCTVNSQRARNSV